MSESGDCRYEREGYCGYSQETVNALCKSRDDRIRELEAENKELRELLVLAKPYIKSLNLLGDVEMALDPVFKKLVADELKEQ